MYGTSCTGNNLVSFCLSLCHSITSSPADSDNLFSSEWHSFQILNGYLLFNKFSVSAILDVCSMERFCISLCAESGPWRLGQWKITNFHFTEFPINQIINSVHLVDVTRASYLLNISNNVSYLKAAARNGAIRWIAKLSQTLFRHYNDQYKY
jgi:hypothetical protein